MQTADDTQVQAALIELFGVANAPLTPAQRVQRAKPVFEALGMTIGELAETIRRPELQWNLDRAKTLGVSAETWQEALTAAGLDEVTDLSGLLDTMHRAEAASAMLRAGYRPERDAGGKLSWSRS